MEVEFGRSSMRRTAAILVILLGGAGAMVAGRQRSGRHGRQRRFVRKHFRGASTGGRK